MQIGIYEAFLAIDWLGATKQVQTMGRFADNGIDMFSIFQSEHQNGYAQLYCGLDLHGKGMHWSAERLKHHHPQKLVEPGKGHDQLLDAASSNWMNPTLPAALTTKYNIFVNW